MFQCNTYQVMFRPLNSISQILSKVIHHTFESMYTPLISGG